MGILIGYLIGKDGLIGKGKRRYIFKIVLGLMPLWFGVVADI
jgi:hypothetical protein